MTFKCYHCNKEINIRSTLFKHKDSKMVITFCKEHHHLSNIHYPIKEKKKFFNNNFKFLKTLFKNNSRVYPTRI